MEWFDILIYFGALVALLCALFLEYKDLFCPHKNQICRVGNGAVHERGKVNRNDDFNVILRKIRISGRYDESSVYWRRTIIFTVLLLFVLLILTQRRLPTAYEIIVSFIVIYMMVFLFLNYYQRVVSLPATKQIDKATKILYNRYKH